MSSGHRADDVDHFVAWKGLETDVRDGVGEIVVESFERVESFVIDDDEEADHP